VKRRNAIRATIAAAIIGVAIGAGPGAAFADAASGWGYFGPYAGYSYKNQSLIYNSLSTHVTASTTTANQGSGNVPGGYMGADARLFTSTGALKAESGYRFTSGAANSTTVPVQYTVHGTYYSYGVSAVYNGSGNSYVYAYQSPSQNW
jgi:hypothetical protein